MSLVASRLQLRRWSVLVACLLPLSAELGCAASVDDATADRQQGLSPTTVSFQDGQAPSSSYSGTRDTMLDGDSTSGKALCKDVAPSNQFFSDVIVHVP